jgi:colanic acid biosynthesis glycosyl transferase WcaI
LIEPAPFDPTAMTPRQPRVTILYHYFHPDDVVSARHFSDLAEGLARRGWDVTALPCHRGCRDESQVYPTRESWRGVDIARVWRPNLKQSSTKGRLLNAGWMLARWSLAALRFPGRRREVMIVGTDPVLSPLTALSWKLLRPRCRLAHWCFDLYPEAPIAEGMFRESSFFIRTMKWFLRRAYRRYDLIADLGPCMAGLLAKYGSKARAETLVPWALVEPPAPVAIDPPTRADLFGDAQLGLLYSGSFGRAHNCDEFLELARRLRGRTGIAFNFAARGNRFDELKASVGPEDVNIRFAGFAPESELEKRLGACDIHLVSLRPEWTGTVVPSKFFGALATGRAVLFSGSPDSAIARWIEEYNVGWVLTKANLDRVAEELGALAANPDALRDYRERCHRVYREHFAKDRVIDRWDHHLRSIVGVPASLPAEQRS